MENNGGKEGRGRKDRWRDEVEEWDNEDRADSLKVNIAKGGKALDQRMDQIDHRVDDMLRNLTTDKKEQLKKTTKRLAKDTAITVKTWDELGEEYSEKIMSSNPLNNVVSVLVNHPVWVLTIIISFSCIFGFLTILGNPVDKDFSLQNPKLKQEIVGDFTVYLPQGDETKKTLDEIERNWTTDITVLVVLSNNYYDPTDNTSVLDLTVLREISDIEDAINPIPGDEGKKDDVVFVFSISTVVKTINATPEQVQEAMAIEMPGPYIGSITTVKSNYSLPDQETVNTIAAQLPPEMANLMYKDHDGDGIIDTALVLIGFNPKANKDDVLNRLLTPDRKADDNPKSPGLIDDYYVDTRASEGGLLSRESYYSEANWRERYENGDVHCRIVLTGTTPLTKAITNRFYEELTWVTPLALVGALLALFFFHRTIKMLVVSFAPLACALLITFGFLTVSGLTLTPQVLLIAPLLISMSISYGIYIANRYAEEVTIEDKKERIKFAVQATAVPVFLSAITMAIGFGSLVIADMIPIKVMGIGLAFGVAIAWLMTELLVPSIVVALNYKKPTKSSGGFEWLGEIPVNHRKKLIAGALVFTLISCYAIVNVKANMDIMQMCPDDEVPIQGMDIYSEVFNGGQMGMMYIQGEAVEFEPGSERTEQTLDSMRDPITLYKFENIESDIKNDPNTHATPLCIIDAMKMVRVPDFTSNPYWTRIMDAIPGGYNATIEGWVKNDLVNQSFWNATVNAENYDSIPLFKQYFKETPQQFVINIFYNSLSPELRLMMVNADYSRAVMFVDMPMMDVEVTKDSIDQVNTYIDESSQKASDLTGFGAVLVVINEMLVLVSLYCTLLSLALIFGLLFIFYRSVLIVLFTMIPVILVCIWQYSLLIGLLWLGTGISWSMGYSTPYFTGALNLFTAMIGTIIAGVGVDFGIQVTGRVREKGYTREAVKYATATNGMSFIESASTQIGGLMPLMFVNIPVVKEFILLVILMIVISAWGAIMILPAIYVFYFELKGHKQKAATAEPAEILR